MAPLFVHLLQKPDDQALQLLQGDLSVDVRLSFGPQIPEATEILVAGRPSRAQISAGTNLRALIIPFAGVPGSTRAMIGEFPHIQVHNLHHNAAPTAELAIALLLTAAKFLLPCDAALRRQDWRPRYDPPPAVTLDGKTALILGFGQIGERVGRTCHALGMDILAIRRDPGRVRTFDYPAGIHGPQALADLLPHAAALIITLPATPETENLLGPGELSRLPRGSVLVNVGRGAIVDQAGLYQALTSGPLLAAGLDVWYNYPPDEASRVHTPPADYPFQELENVVLSPHRAGASSETEELRMQHLARLLRAAVSGEIIPNQVDLQAGY
ncbi:MAG: hypothetical protein JXB85_06670 [Anaerolineales bacterium]|nr:hypothetical protein [Anaerolineales bacterium]